MSGVGGLFIFQCFYTEVGEKGGGGGLGDGCTLIKFSNFKGFTQTKALWAQELNNCVFGSDIDQFLCMIHQKRTLINI